MEDRLLLVQLYYQNNRCPSETIRKFSTLRGIKSKSDAPTVTAVQNLVTKFESTYSLFDAPRSGRPSISSDYVDQVSDLLEENHGRISTTLIGRQLNIPQSTVHKIVTQHLHMYPYKFHLVHHLTEGDKVKRIEFCRKFLKLCDDDENWISKILFTDEAHFHLNGDVNTHNVRIWSTDNPKLLWCANIFTDAIEPPYRRVNSKSQTTQRRKDQYPEEAVTHQRNYTLVAALRPSDPSLARTS